MKVESLVPMAHVTNLDRSIEFYAKLGFDVMNTFKHQEQLRWAWLRSGGADLMLSAADEPVIASQQAILFYAYTADVSRMREHLLASGVAASPIQYPFYNPRGEFRVSDPDGYVVMIAHLG
jgi:catechol 2,3-dioxygenase-like lactoylglutathione lyase family enzyme